MLTPHDSPGMARAGTYQKERTMNTTTKTRTAEQKAKDAERARARRAARKLGINLGAMPTVTMPTPDEGMAPAPHLINGEWQAIDDAAHYVTVTLDGEDYQVSAALTPVEQQKAAQALHSYREACANGNADETDTVPDVERPAPVKPAKAKRADKTTQRIYLSAAQFKRIEDDAAWRKENAAAWKAMKAGTRVEQKASDGSSRKVYHSILIGLEDAAAVQLKLKPAK